MNDNKKCRHCRAFNTSEDRVYCWNCKRPFDQITTREATIEAVRRAAHQSVLDAASGGDATPTPTHYDSELTKAWAQGLADGKRELERRRSETGTPPEPLHEEPSTVQCNYCEGFGHQDNRAFGGSEDGSCPHCEGSGSVPAPFGPYA